MGTKIKKLIKKIQLKRTTVVIIVFIVMAFILIRQIFELQIIQGENYISEFENRITKTRVLKSTRGNIYDRNGNILATSNKVYNVILDCKTVNSDPEYAEPTIRALKAILGIDEEKVRSLLSDSRTSQSQYQILLKQLSMDKKKEFEAYTTVEEDSPLSDAEKKERGNVKGVV